MEEQELITYIKAEISRINRVYTSKPMPQKVVGERDELEFILDLLESRESAVSIARSIINSENDGK